VVREEFRVETKEGHVVETQTRKHDKQRIVVVYHEDALLKLEPVHTEEQLSQWFWHYVEEFGGAV